MRKTKSRPNPLVPRTSIPTLTPNPSSNPNTYSPQPRTHMQTLPYQARFLLTGQVVSKASCTA